MAGLLVGVMVCGNAVREAGISQIDLRFLVAAVGLIAIPVMALDLARRRP